MSIGNERRFSPRVPFATPVTVHIGNDRFDCRTRDLGSGGLFVYFDGVPPDISTELSIELKLGDTASALIFDGRVVRYGSGGNGIGVAFVEVTSAARTRLSEYVASAL
ncbi:MAG: PilZ domain-containing protein [Myxococcales bacterium]|nr:PilZ domain-containing protein [Myxococcales bacterium]